MLNNIFLVKLIDAFGGYIEDTNPQKKNVNENTAFFTISQNFYPKLKI